MKKQKYFIKEIIGKGYYVITDKKDNILYISPLKEECEECIESGRLERILAQCEVLCQ